MLNGTYFFAMRNGPYFGQSFACLALNYNNNIYLRAWMRSVLKCSAQCSCALLLSTLSRTSLPPLPAQGASATLTQDDALSLESIMSSCFKPSNYSSALLTYCPLIAPLISDLNIRSNLASDFSSLLFTYARICDV